MQFDFQNLAMSTLSDADIWSICYITIVCAMSVLSFCAIRADKAIAIRNGEHRVYFQDYERRYSECSLHTLELMGGYVGSFIAQNIYRHKIRKCSYQAAFWIIVVIHCGLIYCQYLATADEAVPSHNNNNNNL